MQYSILQIFILLIIRLNALNEIKKNFPKTVYGLSDHTGENYTSFAAVAMGASIIEKHFIDRSSRKDLIYLLP